MQQADPAEVIASLRSGGVPAQLKQVLAKGLFPLPPALLLESLDLLAEDAEPAVREEALRNLERLPLSVVRGVASSNATPPALLDRLARRFSQNEMVLHELAVNAAADDETFAYLATLPFPDLLGVIGRNLGRLERAPRIMQGLLANPQTPVEVVQLWQEREDRRQAGAAPPAPAVAEDEIEAAVEEFAPLLTEEAEGEPAPLLSDAKEEVLSARQLSIYQMLKKMSMGQKVALAVKGNREVRNLLIRDKNRMLSLKVLENPRITDSDVEAFAKSTTVSEDVLRGIANRKEWCKRYPVVRTLVFNPKSPLGISLDLLKRLTLKDLEQLTKNRNVPDTLRAGARRLYQLKRDANR